MMNKSVTSSGRTCQQAVESALRQLDAAAADVDVEIITAQKRGILGLMAKQAVVRVTMKPEAGILQAAIGGYGAPDTVPLSSVVRAAERPLPLVPPPSSRAGTAWVQDGRIACQDGPHKYAMIAAGLGVQAYKNGTLIERAVIVRENDTIEAKLEDEHREPQWEIRVSEDRMTVIIKVMPGWHIVRRLAEQPPSAFLRLELAEQWTAVPIESKDVYRKLEDLGVTSGIDGTAIKRACAATDSGDYVIARGHSAGQGKQGRFQPILNFEVRQGVRERADGTVDYREIVEFPAVDRGQVIGISVPPVPGEPGMTVMSDELPAAAVYPVVLVAGQGVELMDDGETAIAVAAGHPVIRTKGQRTLVSVIPKHVVQGDINLESGNIRFIGNLEIIGSVQDGMIAEAKGTLLIHRNVYAARIAAGESITVMHNIISSEVSAGRQRMIGAQLSRLTRTIADELKTLIFALGQLSVLPSFEASLPRTGFGPLVKMLGEGKYKQLPAAIRLLEEEIAKGADTLGDEWKLFARQLHALIIDSHKAAIRSISDFETLVQIAEALVDYMPEDSLGSGERFIQAAFVLNSSVYAAGDIHITGQGTYNANLHATGRVVIDGHVRGGEIYAAQGADVKEAGTNCGVVTRIGTDESGVVRIELARADTIIRVGRYVHKFMSDTRDVHARMNGEGRLLLY